MQHWKAQHAYSVLSVEELHCYTVLHFNKSGKKSKNCLLASLITIFF